MIIANTIQLFKNLAQYDYENKYYDFHNDYECTHLDYSKRKLSLTFRSVTEKETIIVLRFFCVEVVMIDFQNVNTPGSLTIDNIYRGRFELDGNLIEVSDDGKSYFYLEFYEGQKLEFWAKEIAVECEK